MLLLVRLQIRLQKVSGQSWTPTTITERWSEPHLYIPLHQNSSSVDILFSPVDGNPLLRAAFSMKRFSDLLNHIHFDNKDTRSIRRARDILAPIRDVWDTFLNNLAKFYVPIENITVDEQLVGFRIWCKFIQYMPSKPDKYGIKTFLGLWIIFQLPSARLSISWQRKYKCPTSKEKCRNSCWNCCFTN